MELTCIKCGQADSVIRLDLDDGDTLTCTGCEGTFSVADVRACVEGWNRLLTWLDACPARTPEPATV